MTDYIDEDEAIEMAIREAEELYEKNMAKRRAPTPSTAITNDGNTDSTSSEPAARCKHCGSLSVDDKMLKDFGVSVCFHCRLANRDEYRCVSKSRASKEYLLTDQELSNMKSTIIVNPRKVGWKDMRLYLVSQLKLEAMRKWGSLPELEEEKKRRVEAKAQQRLNKVKRKQKSLIELDTSTHQGTSLIEREIKKQKTFAVLGSDDTQTSPVKAKAATKVPLPDVFRASKGHQHRFGPEEQRGGKGPFKKVCKDCGLEVDVEIL